MEEQKNSFRFLKSLLRSINPAYKKLRSLKGKHNGDRCVIVGMGPSLQPEDLEKLNGFTTLTCNKIHLALDDLKFTPDYYFLCDTLVAKDCKEAIHTKIPSATQKIFSSTCKPYLNNPRGAIYYKSKEHFSSSRYTLKNDLLHGLYSGGCTIIFDMIQFAAYMGIKEIFLIGVDHKFQYQSDTITNAYCKSGQVLISNGEQNHFHPNYRKKGDQWTVPKVDEITKALHFANIASTKRGIKIYNASRMSKLEVFEKIPFEEVFKA